MKLLPVDKLTNDEIKEHFVDCITQCRNTIGELKEVLEFFECNGIDDLSPYEKEQRENTYSSLERLHNEIYYLSRLVDYDEMYGEIMKENYESVVGEGTWGDGIEPNGYLHKYLIDYHNKTYVLKDEELNWWITET